MRGPGPDQAGAGDPWPGGGMSWTYTVPLDEALAAAGIGRTAASGGALGALGSGLPGGAANAGGDPAADPFDDEAIAAEMAQIEATAGPPQDLTGRIAEHLPAGPGLAAWLSTADVDEVSDYDLPAIAAGFRRAAAWAQAGELAAVAAMAARAAARDRKVGLGEDGEPARVTAAATTEVALALVMTQTSASWWTHLAVALRWRLRATGAALAAGQVDVPRARLIHEATARLDDETARAVEAMVLPRAGGTTTAQLRIALRRAVLVADPRGAEDRQTEAESRAKVSAYPDEDGTGTLSATHLPGVTLAAMFARLSALALALKAAGAGGGLDFLRAQVLAGLVLGTLDLIGPPVGPHGTTEDPGPGDGPGPGSDPNPSDDPGDGDGPDGDGPHLAGGPGDDKDPGDSDGQGPHLHDGLGDDKSPGDGPRPNDGPGDGNGPNGGPGNDPDDEPGPQPGRGSDHGRGPDDPGSGPGPAGQDSPGGTSPPGGPPGGRRSDHPPPEPPGTEPRNRDVHRPDGRARPEPEPEVDPDPGLGPADLPGQGPPGDPPGNPFSDWPPPAPGPWDPPGSRPLRRRILPEPDPGDWSYSSDISPSWPRLPSTITDTPPVLGIPPPPSGLRTIPPRPRAGPNGPHPAGPHPDARDTTTRPAGLLDLTIPWSAFTGQAITPAYLGRLGPVAAAQARLLAVTAIPDPHAQWRVILTDPGGHALAVERIRRGRSCPRQPGRAPGILGRVTITIPVTALDQPRPPGTATGAIITTILRAAARAAARLTSELEADAQAPGGCAHTTASASYRPPPRIRELVEARDQTCREPICRQPAWRADLDHTEPFHLGGRTCKCNLGGFCRTHHQVKQEPGWEVTQPRPGHFQITTPAGRTYDVRPDTYPA
jgi:Domain of unknown function (DUF222)